ncbi:unnamed protein product, partial [Brachionus calyciflorus]
FIGQGDLQNISKIGDSNNNFYLLYLIPRSQNDVYSLNEKQTFGNNYKKGWVLPSNEELSLDFYIYYNGNHKKIQNFVNNSENGLSLFIFFTSETTCKFLNQNFFMIKIIEQVEKNIFLGTCSKIRLTHSEVPQHICFEQIDSKEYSHQGDDYWVSIITTESFLPTWTRVILFIFLLCLSGLFSGLNLGLMSLDLKELDILKKIGTPKEQSYASKIYPLRKRGNFLLCSILLGNVMVNSISTLLLGDMLSGIYAALGSTILIVVFGEIIPQSACSKHGLAVGAHTRYITYVFMLLTSPLSLPLSFILDKVLGKEIAATYSREKIRELMNLVEGIDDEEKKIIDGAFDFNNKKVREVMTKLSDVFMLELHEHLNFETIAKIVKQGFSRIPIYEGNNKSNIVGLLHVKDFTLIDPDDNKSVDEFLKFYRHPIIFCNADSKISTLFEEFIKGQTHLAFVRDVGICSGIITLEDIIEELIQAEIYDEFDHKNASENDKTIELNEVGPLLTNSNKQTSSNSYGLKERNQSLDSLTSSIDLDFFLQKEICSLCSPQIGFAVFQFLSTTVKPFTDEYLTKNVLELMFKRASFKESFRIKPDLPREYLYRYGRPSNYFILIISGEATIEVGREKLEFSAGAFAYFGVDSLIKEYDSLKEILSNENFSNLAIKNELKKSQSKNYIPDFSLRVDNRCVYLKIDRALWKRGVIKSWSEKNGNQQTYTIDDLQLNNEKLEEAKIEEIVEAAKNKSPSEIDSRNETNITCHSLKSLNKESILDDKRNIFRKNREIKSFD